MSKDNFKWTDELVEEFVSRDPSIHRCKQDMEEFKQSKLPTLPERVEVMGIRQGDKPNVGIYYHVINYDRFVPEDKFPAIKQAIESVLNNDTVVEDKPKYLCFEELVLSQQEKLERAAAYINKYRHDHTMTDHRIAHSLLYPTSTMNAYKEPSPTTQKEEEPPQSTKPKTVLFTTEDGVIICVGEKRELWRVFVKQSSYEMWKPYELGLPYAAIDGERYFSTKEAAEQYILENKPCLSLSDLQKEWFMEDEQVQFGKWEGIPMYRRFQQIVKKKLNQ